MVVYIVFDKRFNMVLGVFQFQEDAESHSKRCNAEGYDTFVICCPVVVGNVQEHLKNCVRVNS